MITVLRDFLLTVPIQNGAQSEYLATDGWRAHGREVGGNPMRKTMIVIATLIGALLTFLALTGSADAATAIEYGLIVAL